MQTRIYITGASGNTGRAFLGDFFGSPLSRGADAVCLVLPGDPMGDLSAWPVRTVEGDASDTESVARSWDGDRSIVNISSIYHSEAVLKGCPGARSMVAISSTGLFSRYRDEASRIEAAERVVTSSGIPWTILRPTMIYGTPLDRNISRLIAWISRGRPVILPGGGRSLFQPVSAFDLASCITAALFSPSAQGKSYEISGGSVHSLRDIVGMTAGMLGRRSVRIPVPVGAAAAMIGIAGKAFPSFPVRPDQVRRLLEDKVYDHSAAAADLGFSPVTFEEGLRREIELMGLPAR
jgi:nucleoside-diphosphate-sugar epimerase